MQITVKEHVLKKLSRALNLQETSDLRIETIEIKFVMVNKNPKGFDHLKLYSFLSC